MGVVWTFLCLIYHFHFSFLSSFLCGEGGGEVATKVQVGVVWTFFVTFITSLFFLPFSGRWPDID